MAEIEHIVVGMDEQGLADQAVDAAIRLSDRLGARLDIIHAVDVRRPNWFADDERHSARVQAEIMIRAREVLAARLHPIRDRIAGARAGSDESLHVIAGAPPHVITEFAGTSGALLMFGRHRERGLFDFGGTVREVLRTMPSPVWLQKDDWKDIRRILIPVDLSPGASAVFATGVWLAEKLDAALEVVYCFEEPRSSYGCQATYVVRDYRRAAATNFEQFLARVSGGSESDIPHRVIDGDPTRAILEYAESADSPADLIVMGSHGHSPFVQALLGSHAYRVLRLAEIPVVVVPQRRRESLGAGHSDPR